MTNTSYVGEDHLTDLEIAAYLDRGLGMADRERIEAHLATCEECRENVLSSEALVVANRRPRRIMITVASLAAVAMLAIVAVPSLRQSSLDNVPITRDTQIRVLAAHSPASYPDRKSLRFSWAAVAEAVDYNVVLSLPDGTTLWSTKIRDTTTVVPDSVTITPRKEYVWSADAELENGDVMSTGLRSFTIAR